MSREARDLHMPYSVGIPVRNEALTLHACVQSALEQDVPPCEVLICLNGSVDGSAAVAEALAEAHSRVRVLTSAPGKPRAWNTIVAAAAQPNVLFVDGDVKLERGCARRFLEAMAGSHMLVVGGGQRWTDTCDGGGMSIVRASEVDGVLEKSRLSGGAYLAATDRLKALAAREGIDLMPPEIIAEDALLECIALRHDGFMLVEALCWQTRCAATLGDLVRVTRRTSQGVLQLRREYGRLVPPEFAILRGPLRYRLLTRLAQLPGIRRKLAFVFVSILRLSVRLYVRVFEDRRAFDNLWPEARSTKVPFET